MRQKATPSVHVPARRDRFRFPDVPSLKGSNSAAAVVLVGSNGRLRDPQAHLLENGWHENQPVALSTSADASAWSACHGDARVPEGPAPDPLPFAPSVLAERRSRATFALQPPESPRQVSLAAGRVDSSPTVEGFAAAATRSAATHDALRADAFGAAAAFPTLRQRSVLTCFPLENLEGLSLNTGCLGSCGEAVWKVARLRGRGSPVATHDTKRAWGVGVARCREPAIEAGLLEFSPKCSFSSLAVLESSAVSPLGLSPFPKQLSRDACVSLALASLLVGS